MPPTGCPSRPFDEIAGVSGSDPVPSGVEASVLSCLYGGEGDRGDEGLLPACQARLDKQTGHIVAFHEVGAEKDVWQEAPRPLGRP